MLKGEEMKQRLLKTVCAGIRCLTLTLTLLAGSTPVAAQESKSLVRLHIPGYSPNSLPFQIAEDKRLLQGGGDHRSDRTDEDRGGRAGDAR
jgi:hypothetical protein